MGQIAATGGFLNSLEVLINVCPKESFRITLPEHLWEILAQDDNNQVLKMMYSIGALNINLSGMEVLDHVNFRYTDDWLQDSFEGSVDILNKLGMDWNIKDQVGRTVLHTLVSRMKAPQAKKLIELGARVDIRDYNCMTPFDLLIEVALQQPVPLPQFKGRWTSALPSPAFCSRPPPDRDDLSFLNITDVPESTYEAHSRTPSKVS